MLGWSLLYYYGMNFTRFCCWILKLTKLNSAKYGFSYLRNPSENFMPWKFIAYYIFKILRKNFRLKKLKKLFCFYMFDRDYFFKKQCSFHQKYTPYAALIYFYSFFGFWMLIKKKRTFDPNEQNTKLKGGSWSGRVCLL